MDVFWLLFENLTPLYLLIVLGWITGKTTTLQSHSLSLLSINVCMPIVLFGFVARLDFELSYFFIPLITFVLHVLVGQTILRLTRHRLDEPFRYLSTMCGAVGNSGYLGLPLVMLLFPSEWIGIYVLMLLGMIFYEATFNYYFAARSQFTIQQSIRKLARLPAIYAIIAGLLWHQLHWTLPVIFDTYWEYFKGAYIILGMMIIGAALSKEKQLAWHKQFTFFAFLGKFVIWPLASLTVVTADRVWFGLYPESVHELFLVFSLVPCAANNVAYAVRFHLKPQYAATTVVLSTLLGLLYIPAITLLLGIT